MRREEQPSEGWYYKQDGQAVGPIPTGSLKGLLAAGRLQPRQAVWRRNSHGLLLVHPATAAFGTTDPRARRRPPSRDRLERSVRLFVIPALRPVLPEGKLSEAVFGRVPSRSATGDGAEAQARLAVTDNQGQGNQAIRLGPDFLGEDGKP
jgi:hypothetical protein